MSLSLFYPDIQNVPVYATTADLQALTLSEINIGSVVYCNDPTNPGQYMCQNVLPASGTFFELTEGGAWWVLLINDLITVQGGIITTQNLPTSIYFDLATGYSVVGNSSSKATQWPCNAMIYKMSTYSASGSVSSYSISVSGLTTSDIALVWPTTAQGTANGAWLGSCGTGSLTVTTYNTSAALTAPGSTFTLVYIIFRYTP